ncbi:MAG: tetratricopeptide repeat protein [Candidatus Zixiibacteriota bacterium]
MDTIIVIFLLAIIALILIYIYYDRYKREKKGKDPTTYIEGLQALLNGQEEMAFSRFRDVITQDSENIDAYIRIGNILRKYGKPDKALQVHKDLTLRHGLSTNDKKMILQAMAEDFIGLKDTESAATALRELLAGDNHNRWAAEKLLDVYTQMEDWEGAYEVKEILLKLDGGKSKTGLAIYKFLQGVRLFDDREFHKSRLLFKEAINLDTACTPAYVYIGDSYLAENRLEDAAAIWRRMIKTIPNESHHVLGRLKKVLFDLGHFGEIETVCNEILISSPKNIDARLTLADYFFKKGEYGEAAEHLGTTIDEHPDSFLPVLELAKVYLVTGEKKKLSELLHKLEGQRDALENQYHCSRCGYKVKTKKWLCPQCKAVDSFVM